jgi:hypothetical protein
MNKKILLLAAFLVALLASIPDIVGFLSAPDGMFYTGRNFFLATDKPVYLGMIEEARTGAFSFHNLFTGEAHAPIFLSPLWWLVGTVAGLIGISAHAAFIAARAAAGVLFLFVLTEGARKYVFHGNSRHAWIAFFILAFSSGFGGLWTFFAPDMLRSPDVVDAAADIWIPEMTTFRTLGHSALFILSQLAIVLLFFLWVKKDEHRRYAWSVALLLFPLLTLHHPYDFFTVIGVLALYIVVTQWHAHVRDGFLPQARDLGALMIVGLIPMVAQFWFMSKDAAFAGWISQNITLTPAIASVLLGYGALVPLTVWGGVRLWRRGRPIDRLLVLWVVAGAVLIFAPLPYQRRLLSGLHIPIALLSTVAVLRLLHVLRSHAWRRAIVVGMLFSLIFFTTPLTVWFAAQPQTMEHRYMYAATNVRDAAHWIRRYTHADDMVLVYPPKDANVFPAESLRRTWLAHGHQTINLEVKERMYWDFFRRDMPVSARAAFLRGQKIAYVVITPDEVIDASLLRENDAIEQVAQFGETRMYRVAK